jgi:UDP-N-acetylmuramyl pentapeptide phosphotransferase/UDP-N-acetylglucosamine-1-phosphate transferase
MGKMIIIAFIALLSTLLLTYLVKVITIKRSILDIPNDRSSHTIPTPRGGGIAIAITWFSIIFVLFIKTEIDPVLFYSLLCGIPIAIIGIVDDIFKISPKLRLIVQSFSAIVAVIILGGLQSIDLGFIQISTLYFFSFIAIIAVVWFTNLFNFLDGIDGYISSEVIIIGVASFLFFGTIPTLFLAAVTAGFLFWNWQPAKIFMGDVGSTFLGFSIAVFAIYYQNVNTSSIIIWLMFSSLFWFDATLTIFRRWRNHETLSDAHRKHAYQRIVQFGFSHQKTVVFSILINIIILGLAWFAIKFPNYSLLFLGLNVFCLFIIVKIVDIQLPFLKTN